MRSVSCAITIDPDGASVCIRAARLIEWPIGGVFGMLRVGPNRADERLSGVDADADLDRRISRRAQPRRVLAQVFLHSQGGVQRALRMVLVRDRRAEQREY